MLYALPALRTVVLRATGHQARFARRRFITGTPCFPDVSATHYTHIWVTLYLPLRLRVTLRYPRLRS